MTGKRKRCMILLFPLFVCLAGILHLCHAWRQPLSGGVIMVALFIWAGFLLSLWWAARRNRQRIEELTDYLERVNTGAAGTLIQNKEDGFSHLQDEIYKTVTTLYATRENALKAKKNFAENLENIAHQFKTPLTAAFLSLQLMEKNSPNMYTKPLGKQLRRLDRLEESLMTLSKIDTGTLQLEQVPIDVYTLLNLASENLYDLLAQEDIRMEIPDQGAMEISGDMEWTMEALMNLMKNCMEHSPRGGRIHCDYCENLLYTEILIWDEGMGFAPEDIPGLFKRFYRGRHAKKDGLGVGLSLARSIIELQNGSLTAKNLPEGGACFEIRFYRR